MTTEEKEELKQLELKAFKESIMISCAYFCGEPPALVDEQTNREDNPLIIICPAYPEYKERPEDQSQCELFDCPKCKSQMWLSKLKKSELLFASLIGRKIILCCYNCLIILIKEDPSILKDADRVDLKEIHDPKAPR
jgi:hypothetical protein